MKKVAAIQMASGPQVEANLFEAERLITKAVESDVELIVLPENFALMGMSESDKIAIREEQGNGRIQSFLSEQAERHGVWMVGGTIPLRCPDPNKIYATCLLFNHLGEQVARYDKIHLFDVTIVDSGESYTESETIESGHDVVVADTPFGRLGLAVCYDLRFPLMYQRLVDLGAIAACIPSAFTETTGAAHWHALIRARAIETQSYMLAPAQHGQHNAKRRSFGHSLVVDPWGEIIAELDQGDGFVIADIDPARVTEVRARLPSLRHRRPIE